MRTALERVRALFLWITAAFLLVGGSGCFNPFDAIGVPLGAAFGLTSSVQERSPTSKGWEFGTAFAEMVEGRLGASVARSRGRSLVGRPDYTSTPAHFYYVGVQELAMSPLVPVGATAEDESGAAVAMSRQHSFVGAPLAYAEFVRGGAVHVFDTLNVADNAFGELWTQRLTAFDAGDGDEFGRSLAVEGEQLLVGAPREGSRGEDAGAAYGFVLYDQWYGGLKIEPPVAEPGAMFGAALAMRGELAVIGAPGTDAGVEDSGAAWVFAFLPGEGAWTPLTALVPDERQAGAHFGCAVDVAGDTVVVGAKDEDGGRGAGYVFVRNDDTWTQHARVTSRAERYEGDEFGAAVAVFDDWAAFGAPGAAVTRPEQGVVDILAREEGQWRPRTRLLAKSPRSGARFGHAMSADDADLLIGSPGVNSAYLYVGFDLLLPVGEPVSSAAKTPEGTEPADRYLALRADADGAQAGYALRRSLRGPFRIELTAGALGGEPAEASDGATFAVGVDVPTSEPRAFHEIRARFVTGGLSVDALDADGPIGAGIELPGADTVDFSIEQVGSALVLAARRSGGGVFEELARVELPDPGARRRPFLRVEGLDEGVEIGFDDPTLEAGDPSAPASATERAAQLVYEAMQLQAEADDALTSDGADPPAEVVLTAAAERLADASTLLRTVTGTATDKQARNAAKRLRNARRQLGKAIKKILKRPESRSVERKLRKAFKLESQALSKLPDGE